MKPGAAGSSSYDPKTALSVGSASNRARIRSNASACTATSASTKTTISQVDSRTPALRAAAAPTSAGSSTTINSSGGSSAERMAATQEESVVGRSVAGTMAASRSTTSIVLPARSSEVDALQLLELAVRRKLASGHEERTVAEAG